MPPTVAEHLPVLVVDDDSQLLRTLADILRARGYEPLVAATGREALARAERSSPPPAIALVDLQLPDMNGLDVIAGLREISALTETVILTGHASVDSAVRALREHSYDYLVKPVRPEQLLITVDRAGERWQRRHAEEALHQSEQRLRLLLDNLSDIVAVVNEDRTIRYVSPSVTDILGYEPEELFGHDGFAYLHPDDRQTVRRLVCGDVRASSASFEARARHRDGSWRSVEVLARNLLNRREIGGFIMTARDVTERRRLEAQLLQAQKMETIGTLAGGIAHDFNNVLSVVIGFSDLLLSRPDLETKIRSDLQEVRRAGEHASQLTRQLLAFARRHPGEPRVFNLNMLLWELTGLLRSVVGEHVTVDVRLFPKLGLVRMDPTQVEQVIVNLAVNARDAMVDGGTLEIVTENVTIGPDEAHQRDDLPAGDYVYLSVKDTGVGMTDDVKARAFEPFFTTKEVGRGTGLGLAMCYGIVRQARGQILLETRAGRGTTVKIYLPRVQAPVDTLGADQGLGDLPLGNETVLVVDDEPAVRRLVVEVLRRQGYTVLAAADGREALHVLAGGPARINLLLTDIVLPGLSGPAIASRARAHFPELKVLLMSGYDDRAKPGSDPTVLLAKPFTPALLARKVRSVLDREGAERAKGAGQI